MRAPVNWEDGVHAVLFVGKGCAPCKPAKTRFTRLRGKYPGVCFTVVDAQDVPKLAKYCEVMNVPEVRILMILSGTIQKVRAPGKYFDEVVGESEKHFSKLLKRVTK